MDIWFREDVRHILMAAEQANALSLAVAQEDTNDPGKLEAFRRGYCAALAAVALAFGLKPRVEARALDGHVEPYRLKEA